MSARDALRCNVAGQHQGRRRHRDVREHRRAAALLGLDGLPVAVDLVGVLDRHVGEDVRVASYQLVDQTGRDVVDGPALALGQVLGQSGVERDLEQDVAELLAQRIEVSILDRLERLVSLFQQVRRKRGVRLLGVPRTPARGPEPVHRGDHVEQPRAGRLRIGHQPVEEIVLFVATTVWFLPSQVP
jgi:hypothetical protein